MKFDPWRWPSAPSLSEESDQPLAPVELFAYGLLVFLVSAILIVAGWNMVLLESGNLQQGGPLQLIVEYLLKITR